MQKVWGMTPAWFRKRWGFAAGAAAASVSVTPAAAQTVQSSLLAGAAPMAIATGAIAFGVIASVAALGLRQKYARSRSKVEARLATVRAHLDDLESLLASMPEVTIVWQEQDTPPRIYGVPENIHVTDAELLQFRSWLADADADAMARALTQLRIAGEPFSLNLSTEDGRGVRALGRPIGSGVALRLRLTRHTAEVIDTAGPEDAETTSAGADQQAARAILSLLQKPAWVRDANGKLTYTNAAYRTLTYRLRVESASSGTPVELFTPGEIKRHLSALRGGERAVKIAEPLPDIPEYQLVLFRLTDGSAGYLGVDENLIRHELNPLDRATFLAERKRIYDTTLHGYSNAGHLFGDTVQCGDLVVEGRPGEVTVYGPFPVAAPSRRSAAIGDDDGEPLIGEPLRRGEGGSRRPPRSRRTRCGSAPIRSRRRPFRRRWRECPARPESPDARGSCPRAD